MCRPEQNTINSSANSPLSEQKIGKQIVLKIMGNNYKYERLTDLHTKEKKLNIYKSLLLIYIFFIRFNHMFCNK